jgi:hypothetical protein
VEGRLAGDGSRVEREAVGCAVGDGGER